MNKVSSQDRRRLIRLAYQMPVGSQGRRAIVSGLSKTSGIEDQYLSILARAADKHLGLVFLKRTSGDGYFAYDGSDMDQHKIRLFVRSGGMFAEGEWSPSPWNHEDSRMIENAGPNAFKPYRKRLTGDVERDIITLKGMLR